jgi:hypothetical protein
LDAMADDATCRRRASPEAAIEALILRVVEQVGLDAVVRVVREAVQVPSTSATGYFAAMRRSSSSHTNGILASLDGDARCEPASPGCRPAPGSCAMLQLVGARVDPTLAIGASGSDLPLAMARGS